MRWRWPWTRNSNGSAAAAKHRAEATRAEVQAQRPIVRHAAAVNAALPDDEFAARVSAAFRRRHA